MKNFYLILLSALLFTLSLPPFDLSLLIYVAFVPFLYTVYKWRQYNDILIHSTIIVILNLFFILNIEDLSVLTKICFLLMLLGWVFLFELIVSKILINLNIDKWFSAFVFASSWTIIDIISQKVINFSWFLFLTQYNQQLVLHVGKVFSVHFITFLIVLTNYIIFNFFVSNKKTKLIYWIIIFVILFACVNCYYIAKNDDQRYHNIVIVQPNKTLQEKHLVTKDQYYQDLQFYSLFDPQLFKNKEIDFIVWPETVINRWIFRIPEYKDHLLKLSKETNAYLIIGAPDLDFNLKEYNSVFIVTPEGKIHRYSKNNTVPLMEKSFTPGENKLLLSTKYGPIEFLVCWESLSIQKNTSSQITFILSSDLVFGNSHAVLMHSRLGIFTAIEKDASVVLANYSGKSALINFNGEIQAEAPMLRPYILEGKLPVKDKKDFRFRLMNLIYLIFFLVGLNEVFNGKKKIVWKYQCRVWMVLLLLILVPIIIKSNLYIMDKKNRNYLPQLEIINTKFEEKIIRFETSDTLKECLKNLMKYYGIYITKYFNVDELEKYTVNQIVAEIGFQLVETNKYDLDNLFFPVIASYKGDWCVIYRYENRFRVFFTKEKFVELDIDEFSDDIKKIYILKPLKMPFDQT
ncbi:MAG: hypothetical protein KAX49_08475 [Halanaerobiales bacterium]|nr:hypothetical protein [Halanaerobiales bacterium]